MRSCILHIGTEKSGTTTLQEWLYCNRLALSERGFYLSEQLGQPNNRIFLAYFSRRLDEWAQVRNLSNVAQKDLYMSGFESTLRQELREAIKKHEQVVISSEHLHSRIVSKLEIQEIYTFLTSIFDQVYVVCYFRHQADMGLSLYSTALKFGHAVKIEQFMNEVREENYYYNFENIADNWSGVFGKENCIFRIYNRKKLAGADIRCDFLEVCGINSRVEDFNFKQRNSNDSLSKASAAAFRVINILLPATPDKQSFARKLTRFANKALKWVALKSLSSVGGKLNYRDTEEVNKRFSSSNARFFAKYLDGVEHF
jgi:hypothetical protein